MCNTCGALDWCFYGCSCYGCTLRAKDIAISGETVAGTAYGRKPLILTDTPADQATDAYQQWKGISDEMKRGGAVAEDALQQPCETQLKRMEGINPTAEKDKPLAYWNKVEKAAATGTPIES